jgi:hypothetical protein
MDDLERDLSIYPPRKDGGPTDKHSGNASETASNEGLDLVGCRNVTLY